MGDSISEIKPKRLMILDVSNDRPIHSKNFKHKSSKKKKKNHNYSSISANEKQEICDPIPLELKKVIDAAMLYGKQTYALGARQGATALSKIATSLKEIISEPGSNLEQGDQILELIELAESESRHLVTLFCSAYNDD